MSEDEKKILNQTGAASVKRAERTDSDANRYKKESGGSGHKKVIVIPCSGMGKSVGSVARETALKIEEKDSNIKIICLASLTAGVEESIADVKEHDVYTIDGCKLGCARKNVEINGGKVKGAYCVLTYLKEAGLAPKGVIELNPDGEKLVGIMADDIRKKIEGGDC